MVGPPPPLAPELAAALGRELRLARRATAARLVEFMAERGEAEVEEVAAEALKDAGASDDAVRKLAQRANRYLAELGAPVRFRVASGHPLRCP